MRPDEGAFPLSDRILCLSHFRASWIFRPESEAVLRSNGANLSFFILDMKHPFEIEFGRSTRTEGLSGRRHLFRSTESAH
jgi:hypothetical protein